MVSRETNEKRAGITNPLPQKSSSQPQWDSLALAQCFPSGLPGAAGSRVGAPRPLPSPFFPVPGRKFRATQRVRGLQKFAVKQSWSDVAAPTTVSRLSNMVLVSCQLCEISSQKQVLPLASASLFLFACDFLGSFQLLGDHCFNTLIATGRDIMSL